MPRARVAFVAAPRGVLVLASTICVAVAAASCSGSGSSPAPAPTPAPRPPTENPAPPALQGVWVAFLGGSNERVTLTLTESTYGITRGGDNAGGTIAVQGDQIQFKRAACGNGTYRWSLNGNSLTFTQLDTDPCDGRVLVLDGQIYTKSG